ncbi:MAG: hypothetical protein PHO10_06295 [Gemmiger sp.]|nr:hypothetical protein [Gemmiger sp.]
MIENVTLRPRAGIIQPNTQKIANPGMAITNGDNGKGWHKGVQTANWPQALRFIFGFAFILIGESNSRDAPFPPSAKNLPKTRAFKGETPCSSCCGGIPKK